MFDNGFSMTAQCFELQFKFSGLLPKLFDSSKEKPIGYPPPARIVRTGLIGT
jgi:hypothetical protein